MRSLRFVAVLLLAACGTKGPLVLPPPKPAQPAQPAQAPQPVQTAPADNSSKTPAEAGQ